jgi:FkbM family methyltransferase
MTRDAGGRSPNTWERLVCRIFHQWPFLSGCGTLADSALARRLVPATSQFVWADLKGSRCLVPLDDLVGRAVFLVGDLDRKISWVLDRAVRPGDTVLDVGANLGLVSVQLAQRVGASGQVLAFEPSPVVLPLLRSTIAANHNLKIQLIECGLGEIQATLLLTVPPSNAGGASFLEDKIAGKRFLADVRPLAAVLSERSINRINLMKIDVEGLEVEVLRGLFDDSCAPRPGMVLLEVNSPAQSEAFAILRREGYRVFGIPKRSMFSLRLAREQSAGFLQCHDYLAVLPSVATERKAALGVD